MAAEEVTGGGDTQSPRQGGLSAGDVCKYLGISSSYFRRLRSEGKLPGPAYYIGTRGRWLIDDLREWVESGRAGTERLPQEGGE